MYILYNASIQTLTPNLPTVTALAIEGDQIVAAGTDTDILNLANSKTRTENLAGQTVWPGLTDAHIHLQKYALNLHYVDCETSTRAECLARVAHKIKQSTPDQWIRGHGWNQNLWPEGFGSAADLDALSPIPQPIYLTAKSLHAGWANTRALQLAGITATTPDPEGGVIRRDASGKPDGILMESAMNLLEKAIPTPGGQETLAQLSAAQAALWQLGITGVHDFDPLSSFVALQQLDLEERLRLRVVKSIPYEALPFAVALGLRTGFGGRHLRIGSIKMFADGALGPRTAAMLQPYAGEPENSGILLLDSEEIQEAGQQAARSGLSLAIHAIGDRANHEVLSAYAHLREYENENHLPRLRHRIEHVQILHPDDLPKLAALHVIASVQPLHATSDMSMADRYWGQRSAGAYAYGSLRDAGTALAFGSDAPVEQPNPFLGIHAAVTRQRTDGAPGPTGWYPRERMTLLQTLHGFTTGPAYAAHLENRLGRLAPGFFADLIVLPVDPFHLPVDELHTIRPTATMLGGEWVWRTA
jgi:predicted amidohydrolase YtcJ